MFRFIVSVFFLASILQAEAHKLGSDYGHNHPHRHKITPLKKHHYGIPASDDGNFLHFVEQQKVTRPQIGGDCEDLSGFWYNQLGSELFITTHNRTDGALTGEYRTAVETSLGAAGLYAAVYHGKAAVGGGASSRLLGFSVHYPDSVAAWSGQCQICGEYRQPEIRTTWVLTTETQGCEAAWGSARVGTDVYTRYEQMEGPRKRQDTHVPDRFREL